MPRRKTPTPDAPPIPDEKPDDLDTRVWDIGRAIGNVALAGDLIDVADGVRRPKSEEEVTELIEISSQQQTKALKRYLKLKQGIGSKLAAALTEYHEHRRRTDRLAMLIENNAALTERANGHDPEE